VAYASSSAIFGSFGRDAGTLIVGNRGTVMSNSLAVYVFGLIQTGAVAR
jgi:hypothetical protein